MSIYCFVFNRPTWKQINYLTGVDISETLPKLKFEKYICFFYLTYIAYNIMESESMLLILFDINKLALLFFHHKTDASLHF